MLGVVRRGPKKIFGVGVYAVAVAIPSVSEGEEDLAYPIAVGTDPGEVLRIARSKVRKSKIRWNLVLCAYPTGGKLRTSTRENRWTRHGDDDDLLAAHFGGALSSRIEEMARLCEQGISSVVANLPSDLALDLD